MTALSRDVFINCPFDAEYKPLFYAIMFTVIRSGFRARCALETDDASENRFAKICSIIKDCRYGVHDISRTEADGDPPLPRFNMPLELGVFLGAKSYGGRAQKNKRCIIFDRERYRFQRYISDIAGQDIHSHEDSEQKLIKELATWLRDQSRDLTVPGGRAIAEEFARFKTSILPAVCKARSLEPDELTFGDFNDIVAVYVASPKSRRAPRARP
jgi:hypothetical protein